ncbi:DUF6263 family protein [Tautonia rosea]|uniref:DUF6263 family protein n=1 Tax=Tautonia rosea TaxID=2728037 RepID=UPI001474435B|nr:DUF6263 family protein [Tautonia rosea]
MPPRSRSVLRWVPMVCLLLAVPAGAAETLRWTFAEGDTHSYELNQTTVTTAMVQNQEVKTTINQTVDMAWKVDSVNSDGSARVAQTIERVRVSLDSQFASFEYDSQDEAAGEGPAAMLKPVIDALVGARVVLVMTPRGEVNDVEVPDEMIERLRNAGPGAQALQNLASAEGMKGLIGQSTLILPEEGVEPGATWTRKVELPTPQGTLALTNTYSLDEAESDATAKISLSMNIDEFKVAPDAPFEMKVEEQNGTGSYTFDTAAGRLSASEVKQGLRAVISVQGQEITSITDSNATFTRTGD